MSDPARPSSQPGKDDRIAILGAGPAGLLTAHYLKEAGYTNVIVLERLGRIGGLCKTITYNGHSFDLGANYVTPAYTEIRKIAKQVGASMYTERPFIAMTVPDSEHPKDRVSYDSMFNAVRVEQGTGKKIGALRFLWANAKYVWKRFKLRKVIDAPTFAGIENHPEVCKPFGQWLADEGLDDLATLFQLPVNMMGYGTVKTTPAQYALKFMSLKSFVPMVMKEAPFIGKIVPWPKRFTDGYQRLFERLSWTVDVRMNVHVTSVERSEEDVLIHYQTSEQILNEIRWTEGALKAKHLILACPLTDDVLSKFLDSDQKEKDFLGQIDVLSYCMSTHHLENATFGDQDSPLAACYPLPELGTPWGVAKQWSDSDFVQFYVRVDPKEPYDSVRKSVEDRIKTLVEQMDARISLSNEEWSTFNRWPYFQHVDLESIENGWYSELEERQGNRHTYFVGGATNFELIEPIAEYAKNLVATHFPRR